MRNPLKGWDEKGLSPFHLKTALVAGAGQFVDGYDLTAGALVFSLIEQSLGQRVWEARQSPLPEYNHGKHHGGLEEASGKADCSD